MLLYFKNSFINWVFKIESLIPEEYSMTVEQDQFFIYFKGKISKKNHFHLEKEVEEPVTPSQELTPQEKIEFQQLLYPIKYSEQCSEEEALQMRRKIDYLVMEIEQERELNTMKMDSIVNNRHLDVTVKIA